MKHQSHISSQIFLEKEMHVTKKSGLLQCNSYDSVIWFYDEMDMTLFQFSLKNGYILRTYKFFVKLLKF